MGGMAARRRPRRRARTRPRSAAHRSRCRGTSPARRAARGSGRRRADRAAPRAARRPAGRRRGRRAPGPTGRRRRGRGPSGRGQVGGEVALEPAEQRVGQGRQSAAPSSVAMAARRQRPLELARVAPEARQQRMAHPLVAVVGGTVDRAAPARPGSAQSAGDGCGSQTWTSRSAASASSSSISVTDSRVWPNSESRDRQVEGLGVLAQRRDGVGRDARAATGRRPGRPVAATARAARRGRRRAAARRRRCRGPRTSRRPATAADRRTTRTGAARRRATEKRRPIRRSASSPVSPWPRCRASVAAQGSSRQPSITSSSGQASASGAHGSSSRVPVISATSDPGERNATAAHTPSPSGPAPSTWESRWESHRSMPRAGTTTSSLANGSGSGVDQEPAQPVGQRVGAHGAVQVEAHGRSLCATGRRWAGRDTRQPPPRRPGAGADDGCVSASSTCAACRRSARSSGSARPPTGSRR